MTSESGGIKWHPVVSTREPAIINEDQRAIVMDSGDSRFKETGKATLNRPPVRKRSSPGQVYA
jgi:hypothetical protein